MGATTIKQASPAQVIGKTLGWISSFIVLVILYFILFAAGGGIVAPYLPTIPAEPGPVPQMVGLLIVCATTVFVVIGMIHSSRWQGRSPALAMSVAFHLVETFVMQLEAWYFLLGITIGPELMSRLFIQGTPTAFVFVPLAVLVMERFRAPDTDTGRIVPAPLKEWLWKLGVIYVAYLVLYYLAGHFIAWLTSYQLLRTLIQVAGAYLVIRGSCLPLWQTALLVGLMLSVPQNIGHILPNSLIPQSSVRMSHLIETASSTFVFGLIVTWLLYPKHVINHPVHDSRRIE